MSKTYKCRGCKAPLVRSEHIVLSHFEDVQEMIPGSDPPQYRTAQESVFKHIPCPIAAIPNRSPRSRPTSRRSSRWP